jgi:hypothetical protein
VQPIRCLVSKGNPTELHRWWRRLSLETRALVEMAGFKRFVELQPTESAKTILLYALAKRLWDTTHTLHIAGVEMTVTSYDIHRMIGLRVDGLTPTFSAFQARFRANREYLRLDLGATTANLPSLLHAFKGAPQGTDEERTRMARVFLLYLIGTFLDCNTAQMVTSRSTSNL